MEITSLPDHIKEFTTTCLHLWVDTKVKLMYTEWLALPSAAEYREAAELFVRTLQAYAVEYWVMESNQLAGFSLVEQRQVIGKIAPAIAASSLKKVARIIAQDEENRAMFEKQTTELKNKYRAVVEIQQFCTFHEVANWITWIKA